jgi:hypothetical protein
MQRDSQMKLFFTLIIFLFLTLVGCENTNEPNLERKLVINGQLNAGYPIDSIFVSWTEDIEEKYDDSWAGGASVTINGTPLSEYADFKGAFYFPDTSYRVQSGMTYNLEATAEGKSVSSQTTVPLAFRFNPIDVQEGDTVQFIPGDSWVSDAFFSLEWPNYNDPNIEIYRVTSLADIATSENFIDDDRNITKILKGEIEDRDNPTIWWASNTFKYARINWMYFNWTGWHSIIVSAMDQNYYQYKQGILFNEQRPGEEYNQVVKGGYGLFCSSASDTIRVYIVE